MRAVTMFSLWKKIRGITVHGGQTVRVSGREVGGSDCRSGTDTCVTLSNLSNKKSSSPRFISEQVVQL